MAISDYREFIWRVQAGLYEEYELVKFIKQELLTSEQERWMYMTGYSIEDLLNGRYNGYHDDDVKVLFNQWNNKCDAPLFKLV